MCAVAGQNFFGSTGGPFNFQSSPPVFGSTSSANIQAAPAFHFGSSSCVRGGSLPSANPSTLPAVPDPTVFHFGNQKESASASFKFSAVPNINIASKADLKMRHLKIS